jgi:TolA-binding protein
VDFRAGALQNRRVRWLLLLIFAVRMAFAAEPGEAEAFAAAAKASQDGFYERAEKAWADFLGRYGKSERANEAALALAQARHQLKQYSGALEVLDARLAQAGPMGDQYRFWRGQTLLDMTNYAGADKAFAELLKTDTNSVLRLNAAVAQGLLRFRQEDFGGVVELMGPTNSIFQTLARESTNATNSTQTAQVARGFLMLAESQLRRNDLNGARASLQALAGRTLPADTDWERAQLLARVEFAGANPERALPALTNALTQARATKRAALIAQTLNLGAEVQKRLGNTNAASQAYEGIIAAEGMPLEQKRLALLKEVELAAAQNAYTNAAARIAAFLVANPQEPSADQLKIKAGEFLLEAYRAQTNKLAGVATNLITEARVFLDTTIQQFTNSPHLGKAWLDRGWTLWEENAATGNAQRLAEAQVAFQTAALKLPAGDEQAVARFKLGDTQFKQGLYAGAATNFEAILKTPNLRTNLLTQAAEQLIRADLAQTNLTAAEAALQKVYQMFPGSPFVEQSWLVMGQTCAQLGQLEKARAVLKDFGAKFPNSPLKPDADLAYARTFAMEEKWGEAADLFKNWTATNLANAGLAQAEFDRAWFLERAGQETNSFQALTNFIARYPTNTLAAVAQFKIGDYYFNPPREQYSLAEQSYQRVFQSTNWNAPELACRARLAAARTAFLRQSYNDARGYLTNLLNSACSQDVVAEAWILLGDVLIEQRAPGATNSLDNYEQALSAFTRVTQMGPTNRFEPTAWGKVGDCHFQLGTAYPQSYESATNAYFKALDSKRIDVPIAVRNQAEVGIALTLEAMAKLKQNPKDRMVLLKAALDRHLNVVYGTTFKNPAPEWQKMAALNAVRLAEVTQMDPETARKLYNRLIEEIPALKATWEAKRDALSN